MNDPPRMRDESLSNLERELIDAGSAYHGSPAARRKTLVALGLASSAALSAGAASASTLSIFEKLGAAKLLAISGLGAAVAVPAGFYAWQGLAPEARPPAVELAAPPPLLPDRAPEPRAASPTPEPPAPALASPEAAPPSKAEARPPASGALLAELAALDRARAKLSAGDAPGALADLDDYARAFPKRRLGLEAEVLRIDALHRSGQTQAATQRAEAFLKRHPNSMLTSRVRAYLAGR